MCDATIATTGKCQRERERYSEMTMALRVCSSSSGGSSKIVDDTEGIECTAQQQPRGAASIGSERGAARRAKNSSRPVVEGIDGNACTSAVDRRTEEMCPAPRGEGEV